MRGHDQMNAHGAGHLGQPDDAAFNLFAAGGHQIGQLVNDDDNIGHGVQILFFIFDRGLGAAGIDLAIVLADVPGFGLSQNFETSLHFLDQPF